MGKLRLPLRSFRTIICWSDATEIYVHDAIDLQAERHRLKRQKQQLQRAKKTAEAKLANKNFLQKAKSQVVTQAKDRLSQLSKELEIVEKHLEELENIK